MTSTLHFHFYKLFSVWNKKNKVPNNFSKISFIDRTHNIRLLYNHHFTLKMQFVYEITILGLKRTMKSALEKIFLKSLHAGSM